METAVQAATMIDIKLVGAVMTPLVTGLVALAIYIKNLHHTHAKEQKENLVTMTTAIVTNSKVIENNTEMVKKVFDKLK